MIYRSGAATTRRLPGQRERGSAGGRRQLKLTPGRPGQAAFALDFATWVAIASIRAGEDIIRLEPEFLETRADAGHLVRLDAGLDHEERNAANPEPPAGLLEQFGMDEIQTVERVVLVLDAAVHMRAANLARRAAGWSSRHR